MKITKRWLDKNAACVEGVAWFNAQKEREGARVVDALITADKLQWANWLIIRLLSRRGKIQYAVFSAEQVLDIFEKEYPADKRPRAAIDEAKAVLGNDTSENRKAAAYAAYAADAAMKIKNIRHGMELLKKETP